MTAVSLGDWAQVLAAVGSLAAVATALWIALRGESERLVFGCNLSNRELEFYLVNSSDRPILIQELEMQLGRWNPYNDDGLELILTQQNRVPMRLDARDDATFGISINHEPGYLPHRIWTAWHRRKLLDRALYVVVTTGQRNRIRYKVPRAVLRELLARAPREVGGHMQEKDQQAHPEPGETSKDFVWREQMRRLSDLHAAAERGMRLLLLWHGGGTIAILTYIGNVFDAHTDPAVVVSLSAFIFGLICVGLTVAIGHRTAYDQYERFNQDAGRYYERRIGWEQLWNDRDPGEWAIRFSWIFGYSSLGAAIGGSLAGALAVWSRVTLPV